MECIRGLRPMAVRSVLERQARRRRRLVGMLWCVLGGAACYDDTPMALKVIDGETSRLIHARTLQTAAQAVARGETLDASARAAIDDAYLESQAAYGQILACEDDGTCRRKSLRPLCDDVAQLLAARRVLASQTDVLGVADQLGADKGPMTLERVRLLRAQMERDGQLSALDEDILALATAAAAAHEVFARTPAGAREAARRRETHAIDEFQLRCDAG